MADVVRVMSREQAFKGETVIKQGDEGDKFYIVDAGEFDVRILRRSCTKVAVVALQFFSWCHRSVSTCDIFGQITSIGLISRAVIPIIDT